MEKYHITILNNGTRVVSEFVPYVKSFSLGFWFNVGTRDETPGNNGISHFIEHMLFKGTKKRSAKKISDEIESYGGYLNAFTSKEHTCYYSRGLTDNIGRTFNVLSDMIQNPLFRESHIKKEAGVVIDELRDIDDNPEELIYDKFEEIIFNGNTLSLPVIGKEGNIKKFDSGELLNFHTQNYKTDNLLIVASGNVEHEKLVVLTKKYISQSNGKSNLVRKKFHRQKADDLVLEKNIQQVHTILGCATVGFKSKKRIHTKLLSTLLGEGSSSRLFQAVREKLGITYQINSFLNSYNDISAFGVYYSTNLIQTDRVMEIILREFRKLRERKVTEKELRRVKEYLKGSFLLNLENTTNRMIRIANSLLYYNKILNIDEHLTIIDSVTQEDIQEQANRLLDEGNLSKVILKSIHDNKLPN